MNKIYARWKLTNEKQQAGESLDSFQLRLMIIAKDCGFGNVTAVEYKNEAVLQSFVSGLEDSYVRQRILEMNIISLEEALAKTKVLKRAKNDAEKYDSSTGPQSSLSAIKNEEPYGVSEFHPEDLETTIN